MEIGIIIDKITDCLIERRSGNRLQTEVGEISTSIL